MWKDPRKQKIYINRKKGDIKHHQQLSWCFWNPKPFELSEGLTNRWQAITEVLRNCRSRNLAKQRQQVRPLSTVTRWPPDLDISKSIKISKFTNETVSSVAPSQMESAAQQNSWQAKTLQPQIISQCAALKRPKGPTDNVHPRAKLNRNPIVAPSLRYKAEQLSLGHIPRKKRFLSSVMARWPQQLLAPF